jgi:hypothetical protein
MNTANGARPFNQRALLMGIYRVESGLVRSWVLSTNPWCIYLLPFENNSVVEIWLRAPVRNILDVRPVRCLSDRSL